MTHTADGEIYPTNEPASDYDYDALEFEYEVWLMNGDTIVHTWDSGMSSPSSHLSKREASASVQAIIDRVAQGDLSDFNLDGGNTQRRYEDDEYRSGYQPKTT